MRSTTSVHCTLLHPTVTYPPYSCLVSSNTTTDFPEIHNLGLEMLCLEERLAIVFWNLGDKTYEEGCNAFLQGCSYHRINDTVPPTYRGPNMCKYSTTNRAFFLIKGPEGVLIRALHRASYASVFSITFFTTSRHSTWYQKKHNSIFLNIAKEKEKKPSAVHHAKTKTQEDISS
ncbi:hypothetical protein TNCV_2630291 [Trichonephila clavipes]|uniref:Uncharacterized protein n=1 Tax=Trichonephila clavipes TaxID=2585209 RepID=A0A8X6SAD4_TRICX|nr:hypothetical protein TNCV_2630291 [Trichonephila clavipes]